MIKCKHTDRPAVARCVVCGMTLCHACRRAFKKKNYCVEHWPRTAKKRMRSPTLAFLLSVMPGIGQIYAGATLKGLFFIGALIYLVANHGTVPPAVTFFTLAFCAWDARMTALKRNTRVAAEAAGGAPVKYKGPREGDWVLWGGTIMIALLYAWLPGGMGVSPEPWTVWVGFLFISALAVLMGRGGKDVQQA